VEPARKRSPGMRAFSVVWFGQLVSMLGTGMALLMAIWGLFGVGACVVGYLLPVVRDVEATTPDHDSALALVTSQPA
jgi:hypothetical protein